MRRLDGGSNRTSAADVGGRWAHPLQLAVVTLAYFLSAKGGLALASTNESVTAVWAPTGVALAAVLLLGFRVLPAVALGAFLANITTAGTLPTVLGITAGNTLEATVGAFLLLRVADFHRSLDRVRDVVALVVLAAGLATTISATIGVASLWAGGAVAADDLGLTWRLWWLGDAAGALIVAPALLLAAQRPHPQMPERRALEAIGLAVILIASCVVAFNTSEPIVYLIFPLLFWSAIRFEQLGAVLSTLILAAIAVWFTARGHGPFADSSLDTALLREQAFVGVAAVNSLLVAVLTTERQRLTRATQNLQRSETNLSEAQSIAHLGSWEWDVAANRVTWSEELYSIYGLDPAEFEATFEGYLALVHTEDRQRVADLIQAATGDGKLFLFDERIVRPDGEIRTLSSRGRPILNDDGRVVRMVGVCQDVTETREAVEAMHSAEERFRNAFDHAPIGVALVDAQDSTFLDVNDSLCRITGRTEDELLATSPKSLVHPADRDRRGDQVQGLLRGEVSAYRSEQRLIDAGGRTIWVEASASLVRSSEGEPLYRILQLQDISERKDAEAQLQYLADHDAMTGLFNRRRFIQELDEEVARGGPDGQTGAVLLIDVDHFKYVNDTLGHAVGDDLITRLGTSLREWCGRGETVARLGGDEFAVLLPRSSEKEAVSKAEDLRARIQDAAVVPSGGSKMRLTASVGVSLLDGAGGMTGPAVLSMADVAMYSAKEEGRDRVHVQKPTDEVQVEMRSRLTWSERVRDALENDRFVLHRQPIVDLETGRTVANELLLRMVEGDELVHPAAFLYVAEEFGMMEALDRWVIGRATELVSARRSAGEDDLKVAINVSGTSITDDEMLAFVEEAIAANSIPAGTLIFEVTETEAIRNLEKARRFAARVAELGCELALDDFGTGFGSFYHLKHLRFDYLKIDGDFVRELPDSKVDQLTVQAIVKIARGLGRKTIAEFVESTEALELLRGYGVDWAQGFALGRPDELPSGVKSVA